MTRPSPIKLKKWRPSTPKLQLIRGSEPGRFYVRQTRGRLKKVTRAPCFLKDMIMSLPNFNARETARMP